MNINFRALANNSWEMLKGTAWMGISAWAISHIYQQGAVQFSAKAFKADGTGAGAGLLALVGIGVHDAVERIFDRIGWPEERNWQNFSARFCTTFTISAVFVLGLAYKASQGNRPAAYLLTASIVYDIAMLFLYGAYIFHAGLEKASQAIFSPEDLIPDAS